MRIRTRSGACWPETWKPIKARSGRLTTTVAPVTAIAKSDEDVRDALVASIIASRQAIPDPCDHGLKIRGASNCAPENTVARVTYCPGASSLTNMEYA
jgi:hypothetical protein